MSVKIHSAEIVGIDGAIIDVEIDLSPGLHTFSIVGLADKAVDESRHRIAAAIKNFGARPPHKKNNRVTVSLAPADLKKEGPAFDLPIALAYLLVSEQAIFTPEGKLFLGELALDGTLRPVKGTLSLAIAAQKYGYKELYVPYGNGMEAALVNGITVYEARHLKDIVYHLEGSSPLSPVPITSTEKKSTEHHADFSYIKGQEAAKRGLEIAAAGGHNIALSGPPGSGKTLLSRALPSILPPPEREEIMEITQIHSIAGIYPPHEGIITERPFRSPHHTASHVALVGGGTTPRPGEITLAHRGILFLDEFPEFEKRVLEALRQPLEDGVISISRARGSITFPARIMLVAAMNPCPCGNTGSAKKECICPPHAIDRYARRISGPIMDRIDMWLTVDAVEHDKLSLSKNGEPSSTIRDRVEKARIIQKDRLKKTPYITNSDIGAKHIQTLCVLSSKADATLQNAASALELSARSYHRVIKIARTIADLAGENIISENHILEAIQYRPRKQE
ncbi:MAG: magnesium chelatase [Candidatus Ryanbacteria bacterium CG10_big_fil_rev_8_21_14_0_10_43_42]|uniref:Magnesium chelatase n=1 Tax=Candidatus Ryanbacteria bacterium CG10_big_fil_rev_8_21_14_0_10_43_42 TaxID=1974864 RepID=A0A2M8KWB4_9BACT|nr:MAG: magnesium chelatase [Candidatus Ryanbacteria bacterium CG10_big_fil_rev_8_21_14_0_10_43_42]